METVPEFNPPDRADYYIINKHWLSKPPPVVHNTYLYAYIPATANSLKFVSEFALNQTAIHT